ncbi:MAG: hypothetical protein J07HR59_01780, partial [Halorubrum sp. J07HR59]
MALVVRHGSSRVLITASELARLTSALPYPTL